MHINLFLSFVYQLRSDYIEESRPVFVVGFESREMEA